MHRKDGQRREAGGTLLMLRMSVGRMPWSRELAEDEYWFAEYAERFLRGCSCKVLTRLESLNGTMYLCRGEESGGLPKQIRGTHPYAFRSGEWASIAGVRREDRDFYVVWFDDGAMDLWVVNDPSDPYEFK
jgi:hypothetical protein